MDGDLGRQRKRPFFGFTPLQLAIVVAGSACAVFAMMKAFQSSEVGREEASARSQLAAYRFGAWADAHERAAFLIESLELHSATEQWKARHSQALTAGTRRAGDPPGRSRPELVTSIRRDGQPTVRFENVRGLDAELANETPADAPADRIAVRITLGGSSLRLVALIGASHDEDWCLSSNPALPGPFAYLRHAGERFVCLTSAEAAAVEKILLHAPGDDVGDAVRALGLTTALAHAAALASSD